jgi:hypothetical protein
MFGKLPNSLPLSLDAYQTHLNMGLETLLTHQPRAWLRAKTN